MPEGNRSRKHKTRLIVGGAIAAAVLVLFGLVAVGLLNQAGYQHYAEHHSREHANYAGEKAREACAAVAPAQLPKCLSQAHTEAELDQATYEHDQADLIAQRKAALWAEMMGVAALLGMGLSGVGVALVWITFRETKESNRISRETAQLQLRPYLYFEDATLDVPLTRKSKVRIPIKNYGHLPALNVKLWFAGTMVDFPIGDQGRDLKPNKDHFDHLEAIGPQAKVPVCIAFGNYADAQLERVRNGEVALIGLHIVEYEGAGGIKGSDRLWTYIDKFTARSGEVMVLNEWAREHGHELPDDSPEFDLKPSE